ncbi:glutamate/gamma-aminobutyrate family transporter YjeM [Clostridium perfringens]|uniref:glutamate/gamma-aminobutyrate family transporter YjeM n=1 Tax=Clostridium perfringens TaxID=1502 RepID=UPI000D71802F|nr:glutamate/gamma-aminobutyrate family transporter YjeM [Clostridium perfringens]ELC8395973.1 glutamate/gamma-aminobutyrate family transporter YjeM [Clostridium perfringens]MBO3361177.1 glutamate/gamma-aminobutyrate family transporter YjeM [Clostridium perfringens]PWX08610.1 glutamate/gamma-aminobutyrate family transporter YjeM [Clostridium perfringens]STB60409.1 amino acid permease [Clostridium perfringens]
MSSEHKSKLSLTALILMIFTSVYGFANMPKAFYLMGYSAIPWYIISALAFSIPYAFMMAEYGAAFRKERGGIYSWMAKSVGPKYAFIVTFMWYSSNLIWLVSNSSSIWIPFSNVIYGKDTTGTWSLLGLSVPQTMAVLGSILIIVITYAASKGLKSITKVTSIGGTVVALSNIVLILGAIIVFVSNGFKPAEIINGSAFVHAQNPSYQSPIGVLGFLVFAVFAYGGLEAVSGLVDETKDAKKNFPKGLMIASIIIAVGYAVGILCVGLFTNWQEVLSGDNVNLANVAYIVIQNLGVKLGQAFGMSINASLQLGAWFARYIGLSMMLALMGAFFTLSYAPIKQLIEGTPKEIWPKKWTVLNENNMPVNAMWVQCIVVVIFILVASFGGESANKFFSYLILMGNVAMTIPYMFLSGAFPAFKKKKHIEKPFVMYKSYKSSLIWSIIVTFTIGFANLFTIIKPVIQDKDYTAMAFQITGPIVFSIIAFILYHNYEKKMKNK